MGWRTPCNEGEVLAHDAPLAERGLERAVRCFALRDHQEPRGVLVQAVNDAWAPRLAARRAERHERLRQRAAAVAGRGMHHHACRLVDNEQVGILENDGR